MLQGNNPNYLFAVVLVLVQARLIFRHVTLLTVIRILVHALARHSRPCGWVVESSHRVVIK